MGCGNSPAMTAADEGLDQLPFSTKPSGASDGGQTNSGKSTGADVVTSSYISVGYAQYPQCDVHRNWQSYSPESNNVNYCLCGVTNLSFSNDSKADESLINVKRDLSEFHRESGIFDPDVSRSKLFHPAGHNIAGAESLMDAPISSVGHKSEVHMNLTPLRFGTAAGFPLKVHGAEAKRFRISTSPKDENSFSPESNAPVLLHVDNFGVGRNDNDINVIPFPIRTPQQVDGSFLTLGIGGGRENRSNCNFNPQEIASKLEDAISLQINSSHVEQNLKDPSKLADLAAGSARIPTNSGGLSNSAHIFSGSMSTCDESGHFGNKSAGLKSNQFPGLQVPQANAQPILPANYNNVVFDPSPLSFPFRRPSSSQSEFVMPPLRSPSPLPEVTQPAYFSSQSIPQRQAHYSESFKNVPSESSRNYPSNLYIGSSYDHVQLGERIPPTHGRGMRTSSSVHFQPGGNLTSPEGGTRTEVATLGSLGVRPVEYTHASQDVQPVNSHGNSLFPETVGFPVPNWRTFHSSVAGPFPKRLGIQPNGFPMSQPSNDNFQRPIRPPFAFGPPPTNLRPVPLVNPFSSALSSGQQHHRMPVQLIHVPPVTKFEVRLPQTSPVVSHPSLKRQATENPPAIYASENRKVFPQPAIHPPHKRQTIPAPIPANAHIPPVPHVKWQGWEESLKPTGQKCYLCKRDLSYIREGQAFQSADPPAVAVLPCSHAFHDHCLQLITPEDQSKNPPCIPCAIGET